MTDCRTRERPPGRRRGSVVMRSNSQRLWVLPLRVARHDRCAIANSLIASSYGDNRRVQKSVSLSGQWHRPERRVYSTPATTSCWLAVRPNRWPQPRQSAECPRGPDGSPMPPGAGTVRRRGVDVQPRRCAVQQRRACSACWRRSARSTTTDGRPRRGPTSTAQYSAAREAARIMSGQLPRGGASSTTARCPRAPTPPKSPPIPSPSTRSAV